MSRTFATLSSACAAALLAAGCAAPSSHAPPAGASADATLLRAPGAASATASAADEPWSTGLIGAPSDASSSGATAASASFGAPIASAPLQDDSSSSATQAGAGSARHLTLMLGQRWLDEGDWEPVDEPIAAGVEFDEMLNSNGDGYEVGLLVASEEDDFDHPVFGDVDVENDTIEFYGGYRHTFVQVHEDVQPYVSGGGTLLHAEVDTDGGPGADDDDTSLGLYVRAGVNFALSSETRLGIDMRHVFLTDVDIGDIDDADYDQFMVTIGFPF